MATSTFDREIKLNENAIKKLINVENTILPVEPLKQFIINKNKFEEGDRLLDKVLFR